MQETRVQSLGREDLLEKEMATHPSILAWKILWTEESGGLQSTGSQRDTTDELVYKTEAEPQTQRAELWLPGEEGGGTGWSLGLADVNVI